VERTAVSFDRATLAFGGREVWRELSVAFDEGSFVAILGPNGSGKTSLLRVVLGLAPLDEGSVEVFGSPPHRGNPAIGYIPQQHNFDRDLPLRGRDLVRLGLDGHRWGIGRTNRDTARRVEEAIGSVEAQDYADAPVGRLSGGEQQRLRIAQALVGDPKLLLCDEPLAHLDMHHQREIVGLIGGWQRDTGRTVLFVTHDINPILPVVDRVLFVVRGRWAAGTPDEILTSERLSDLYASHVDVLRVHERILVVGDTADAGFEIEDAHHLPAVDDGPAHHAEINR
jgi:zinc/manganese transport system ATP-binding protein